MSLPYKKLTKLFAQAKANKLLSRSEHGLERECLRVDMNGEISQEPHPEKLGSALTNPYISTDFAEPLLEFITPKLNSEKAAVNFLLDIHKFVYERLDKDEVLWPFSMPSKLPKNSERIPLAQYGVSNEGLKKTIYRHGLGLRYGRKMQTVAGVHYNFSFSKSFWEFLHKTEKSKLSLQDFISERYFHMMRNFLRYGWLNSYLFGASPAIDKSYMKKHPRALNRCGRKTCYGSNATSLRISDFGYNSKNQKQFIVSFNDLDQYVKDLEYAVTTPNPEYSKVGVYKKGQQIQLNDNWLQNENEYYAPVRPKQHIGRKETVRDALRKRGVKYLEIRSVDIDFTSPAGVAEDQLMFLHTLLVYCLFKPSPPFNKDQKKQALENWNKVGFYGRNTELKLNIGSGEKTLLQWSDSIFHELSELAELLDNAHGTKRYSRNLKVQKEKVYDVALTPSKQMVDEIIRNKDCFIGVGLDFANNHKKVIKQHRTTALNKILLEKSVPNSIYDQQGREIYDDFVYEPYEDMELSTQILIREAEKMKIDVEILDRADNFLLLSKGRKSRYVKQATITARDNMISYFGMGNKLVSKHMLDESGLKVPKGASYSDLNQALADYERFKQQKIVVKPQSTNYGIGINFVEKNDSKTFGAALEYAFKFDKSVIVEEFISGREFRFLVIDDKVLSIVERIPANVTGDGESTIAELVDKKNWDPRNFKIEKYHMKIGEHELKYLAQQRLKPKSILKKGQQIFLRENSNVSTGGDPIDYTDQIPESYKKIARNSAKAAQASFCGVDMIIQDINQEANKENYAIIEINYNPSLFIHEFALNGPRRNMARPTLKAIGF